MSFLRAHKIARLYFYYRLDDFLPGLPLRVRLLLLLMPWRYLSRCDAALSRGERLRLALEQLGPVFVKFGQLLSTRPDLVPADICSELSKLQDKVPPFSSEDFVAIVEQALGKPVDQLFQRFEKQPLASASVAQVHAACLHDGKEVVVKVIRPGIATVIEHDVALMLLLARLVEKLFADGRRLRPVEVVQDYRQTILDELDLQREAANASQLRRNFIDTDKLYVPEVYWDYCRPSVMVMERIYGIPVTDVDELKAAGINFRALAERGVEIFFTQVFEHNFFHADMHPGNIFVSRNHPERPQYIGIDCAIVGSLSREDQYYMARNLLAIFRRDYRQVAELHVECGWVPATTRVQDFESAIRTVCEPIFEKPLGEISFAHVLINLFQTARRFNMEVQPSLVLLQKTLLNIEGLGRQLYPQLDLWDTAMPFLEAWLKARFHPRTLLRELRRYGPEWAEKFPQVPELLFDAVEQVKALEKVMPEVQAAAHRIAAERDQRQHWRLAGLLAAAVAVFVALPVDAGYADLPALFWISGAVAVYCFARPQV